MPCHAIAILFRCFDCVLQPCLLFLLDSPSLSLSLSATSLSSDGVGLIGSASALFTMSSTPQRRSKLLALASRAMPSNSRYSERLSSAPNSPSVPTDITLRPPSPAASSSEDALAPPSMPFANRAEGTGLSSRRSSVSSKGTLEAGSVRGGRPNSLSVNYVPAKFTKLHAPGDWAHRRAKVGGGRDAFAKDAQRMGMMGTVDDDEGVVFQLGKGGLRKKKPKLRWNRFKWILFGANGVVSCPHVHIVVHIVVHNPPRVTDPPCAVLMRV